MKGILLEESTALMTEKELKYLLNPVLFLDMKCLCPLALIVTVQIFTSFYVYSAANVVNVSLTDYNHFLDQVVLVFKSARRAKP